MSETASCFCCPNCGGGLFFSENQYRCENNHCFDVSKYGTVNLLLSQAQSSKRHGDDKLMITARRNFLDGGYYKPLCDLIAEKSVAYSKDNGILLDVGCGEGYYTKQVSDAVKSNYTAGIDISKDALRYAKKRMPQSEFAVASAYHLPLANGSCSTIINIFAPFCAEEFSRVCATDGVVVRAFARKNHLLGLKEVLYENVRSDDVTDMSLDGFNCIDSQELSYNITIDNKNQIDNLFKMTPYYYKTGENAQMRLKKLENLTTEVHFEVCVYEKSHI